MGNLILYKCCICGFTTVNRFALRGHMNAHRGLTKQFNVKLPAVIVDRFTELCSEHSTTTCQVIGTFMDAFIKGADLGFVNLSSPNPVTIVMNQTFLGRPRSKFRIPVPASQSCQYYEILNGLHHCSLKGVESKADLCLTCSVPFEKRLKVKNFK